MRIRQISALIWQKSLAPEKKLDEDYLSSLGLASEASEIDVLAVQNYHRLLKLDKNDAAAQNNIAISLGRLGLKGLQTDYYEKAADQGDPVAASNLAYNLIEAGMYNEARSVLDKCEEISGSDTKIQARRSYINRKVFAEQEKLKEILEESVETMEEDLIHYCQARLKKDSSQCKFTGDWELKYTSKGKPVGLQIIFEDGKVFSEWEEISTSLGTLLSGNMSKKQRHFVGSIDGSALKVKLKDGALDRKKRRTLLSTSGISEDNCLGYLLNDEITLFRIHDGRIVRVAQLVHKKSQDKVSTSS